MVEAASAMNGTPEIVVMFSLRVLGFECGDHGQCVRGSCQCEDRYSGQSCEVAASPCCTLIIACGPSNEHPCAGYDGSCGCAGQCLGSCARACNDYAWCDQYVHGWDSVCDRSC